MPPKKLTLGFIGAGRVGTGLAMGFAQAGVEVVAVASRSAASAQELAVRIPGARVCAPQEVADRVDLVFLTVPDDAIEAVASRIEWRAGSACVHCSGAVDLEVLKKAVADGALAGGFHPLHMFGEAGESPGALADCVIALVREAIALWGKLGIAEADALAALLPLLRGTADNVEKLGAAGGLGSAIARGDAGTIRRHLDALAKEAPDSLELYRILSLRTIPLALAKGTLKPEAAKEITALLLSRTDEHGTK